MAERAHKYRAWMKKGHGFPGATFDVFTLTEIMMREWYELAHYENWDQFTGSKDKKGKEIFENDILQQNSQTEFGSYTPSTVRVIFCDGHVGWEVCGKDDEATHWSIARECEVIGNLRDNPELLK